ncbi:MAG: alpha-ketoglutarate-dependent dioxygenase AlkB [Bradyrhizobium sp.]|nr:alpha-ketoglutarate-dependent dioxygenase AlkB [Bradyrhizobium sp.]
MSQLALFEDQAARPSGLRYQADFLSAARERELIAGLTALPLQPFQFGAFEGHRRVKSFGFRYDYTLRRLKPSEPIPQWLAETARAAERFGELPEGSVRQVLCTEYDVGVGIGWHRDKPHFDRVFGISLGSACQFRFRRRRGNEQADKWQRFTFRVAPRSIYLMDGEARSSWEHSVPPVEERRYSITFRTMRQAP